MPGTPSPSGEESAPAPPVAGDFWERWRRRRRSQKVVVHDHSMEPTFRPGDRLLVDPLAYVGRSPERNDLVVLTDPANPERWLLKRIVGIPGDFVRVTRGGIERLRDRPSGAAPPAGALEELEVPADHLFVLSDRPARTRDSRQFGPVHRRVVVGRVWRRYYPRQRAEEI
jgi:signal peptidase I